MEPVEADHALDVHRVAGLHLDVRVAAGLVIPELAGRAENAVGSAGSEHEPARVRRVDAGEPDHALVVRRGAGLHLDVGAAAGVIVPELARGSRERRVADERVVLTASSISRTTNMK